MRWEVIGAREGVAIILALLPRRAPNLLDFCDYS